jgi:hypothetical protein
MSISLSPDLFSIYNDAVDNIWSRAITLVYPEIREECPNCTYNGFRSNGIYKTGGPYPFANGMLCPWCEGAGFKMIETTEDIRARIYYSQKEWVKVGPQVQLPNAAAQIVAKIDDLPKIQQCKYCVPHYYSNVDNYNNQKLLRVSDFYPMGFLQNPTKYVVTFWSTYNESQL